MAVSSFYVAGHPDDPAIDEYHGFIEAYGHHLTLDPRELPGVRPWYDFHAGHREASAKVVQAIEDADVFILVTPARDVDVSTCLVELGMAIPTVPRIWLDIEDGRRFPYTLHHHHVTGVGRPSVEHLIEAMRQEP